MKLSQEIFNRVFDEESQALRTTGTTGGEIHSSTLRFEYDVNENVLYRGEAKAGSQTSDPVWQIQKFEYDANGNVVAVLFAEGSAEYNKVWDDRATYNYY